MSQPHRLLTHPSLRDDLARALERARRAEERAEALQRRASDAEERTAALAEQCAQAERRLIERDRIAAMSALFTSAAHDIRSPLMALVCNQRLLEEIVADSSLADDEDVRALLDDDRLACELIEGVLSSMRLYATGQGEPGPVSVRSIVDCTIRLFRWHMSQRGIRFEHDVTGSPIALGTASELCQILLNLLSNAAEASPRGSCVHLTARTDGESVLIRVTDEGPGIDPEDLELVFLPFQTRKRDGLGLGLAVSRAMARRHGGELGAGKPSGDRGACFELRMRSA